MRPAWRYAAPSRGRARGPPVIALAELVFWLSATWIAYALVLYPGLALVVGALRGALRTPVRGDATPRLSVLISAYNEEKAIEDKVRRTLALDYPPDRLEVIVASDGSTDRTDEIVRGIDDPRVHLFRAEGRVGKTATLNGAVESATGEILVFSDATGIYSENALRALAARFADPAVGCVAGRVAYRYGEDGTSKGFRGYQRLVVAIRNAENAFGDQTSVSGSIHAVRRALFRPSAPAFSPDVLDAVHTVAQGYRVVYEYDAVSLEDSRNSSRQEFAARVRISVQNNNMTPYVLRELLHARRWFFLFQVVSHKMLRWWMWVPLCILAVSNLVLLEQGGKYLLFGVAQVVFYALAALGMARGAGGRRLDAISSMASFFVIGNAAMCAGAFQSLMGAQKAAWEPVR